VLGSKGDIIQGVGNLEMNRGPGRSSKGGKGKGCGADRRRGEVEKKKKKHKGKTNRGGWQGAEGKKKKGNR